MYYRFSPRGEARSLILIQDRGWSVTRIDDATLNPGHPCTGSFTFHYLSSPIPAKSPIDEDEVNERNSNRGKCMKAPFLIGRVLFGGFFLASGISHLKDLRTMSIHVKAKGVPQPKLAVAGSAIPLLVGGASLLLGVKPKLGALALLGFLAGVSPVMHNFWNDEDPNERNHNRFDLMKNVALAGGALALMGVDEPWEASVPVGQPNLVERVRTAARRIAA